jgi:acyl-CoA reductase-like NAD-dependent aldehyde dehydrogenase
MGDPEPAKRQPTAPAGRFAAARRHAMNAVTNKGAIKTLTTHYVDGAFVESHGREVMDIISPTNGKAIGRVTLAGEEDTRRAIAAAKRAFTTFGRSTKEERVDILCRLHAAASAHIEDLTAAMVEEYGGVVQFAGIDRAVRRQHFSGGRTGTRGDAVDP